MDESENPNRSDGRKTLDMRPVCIRVGVNNDARGSAYVEIGETKVTCTIYGPREILKYQDEVTSQGLVNCELVFAPFSSSQANRQQDSKELSLLLQDALAPAICLHKFPKAQLDVYITILQNAGSAFSAAITCAGIALANAQIEMYDVIIGSSLRLNQGLSLLDPDEDEELLSKESDDTDEGIITLGFLPNLQQIALFTQTGNLHYPTVLKATKTLMEACERMYPLIKKALVRHVEKDG